LELESFDPTYVPVVVDVPPENPRRKFAATPNSLAWLGRFDDFKVPILNHTLAAIERYARSQGRPMTMRLIGAGPLQHQVASLNSQYLTIEWPGPLTGQALTDVLNETDALFAMGTSALEGARLGVPTVLLDFAYGAVPAGYRFRWLFSAERFELGRIISDTLVSPSEQSLNHIFDTLSADARGLSQKTFVYCRDHHALNVGVNKFLSAAGRAQFAWGSIEPDLRRKGAVRRMFEQIRDRGKLDRA